MGHKIIPTGQSWMIKRAQALGYKSDKEGICYGDAHLFMQAILAEDVASFNTRLELINSIPSRLFKIPRRFFEPVDSENMQAQAQRVFNYLSKEEKDQVISLMQSNGNDEEAFLAHWIDIHAFFNGIETYFQQEAYEDLAPKHEHVNAQLPDMGLRFATPLKLDDQKLDDQQAITLCDNFSGNYSKETLTRYFESLQQQFVNADVSVGLVFNAARHAISVGYDKNTQQWMFRDSNKSPAEMISLEDAKLLAHRVTEAFGAEGEDDRVVFATTVFAATTHKNTVKNSIDAWKKTQTYQEIHNASDETQIETEDALWGANWLYIAARSGDENSLAQLIKPMGSDINTAPRDIPFYSPLMIAAHNGHDKCCKLLLESSNIEEYRRDNNGNSFMHIALESGDFPNFASLVDSEYLCYQNYDGINIKDYAVQKGRIKFLVALFKTMEPENVKDYLDSDLDDRKNKKVGQAILRTAIETGNIEQVDQLLQVLPEEDRKAFINRTYPGQNTALHIAAKLGNASMIKYLLDKGCEVIDNKDDKTFVDFALDNDNFALIKELQDLGIQDDKVFQFESKIKDRQAQLKMIKDHEELYFQAGNTEFNDAAQQLLTENPSLALIADSEQHTLLHKAILTGNTKLSQIIVDAVRVDDDDEDLQTLLYAIDKKGNTPLHLAAEAGDLASVQLILNNIDPFYLQEQLFEENNKGQTALHLASKYGNMDMIKAILAKCDNKQGYLLVRDEDDNNALHFAAKTKKEENLVALLNDTNWPDKTKQQKFILRRNEFDQTPLHLAAGHGNADTVRALLSPLNQEQRGKYLLEKDENGESALHYAVRREEGEIVDALIKNEKGHYIDSLNEILSLKNDYFHTPLQIAIVGDEAEPLKKLLEADKELPVDKKQIKRGDGKLLYVAAENNATEALKVLLAHKDQDLNSSQPIKLELHQFYGYEKTTLHAAVVNGSEESIELILNNLSKKHKGKVISDTRKLLVSEKNEKALELLNDFEKRANEKEPQEMLSQSTYKLRDKNESLVVQEGQEPPKKPERVLEKPSQQNDIPQKPEIKTTMNPSLKGFLSGLGIGFAVSAALLLIIGVPLSIFTFGAPLYATLIGVSIGIAVSTIIGGAVGGTYGVLSTPSEPVGPDNVNPTIQDVENHYAKIYKDLSKLPASKDSQVPTQNASQNQSNENVINGSDSDEEEVETTPTSTVMNCGR